MAPPSCMSVKNTPKYEETSIQQCCNVVTNYSHLSLFLTGAEAEALLNFSFGVKEFEKVKHYII